MVPEDAQLVFASTGKTLAVGKVEGGMQSDALEGSRINGWDFRLALKEALKRSHLFPEVLDGEEGDYALSAALLAQNQPAIGFAMTVDLTVRYVLIDRRTGEAVFNDRISSSYTAGVGEAFVAATRVRKANEGAVRENIKAFLNQTAELLGGTR